MVVRRIILSISVILSCLTICSRQSYALSVTYDNYAAIKAKIVRLTARYEARRIKHHDSVAKCDTSIEKLSAKHDDFLTKAIAYQVECEEEGAESEACSLSQKYADKTKAVLTKRTERKAACNAGSLTRMAKLIKLYTKLSKLINALNDYLVNVLHEDPWPLPPAPEDTASAPTPTATPTLTATLAASPTSAPPTPTVSPTQTFELATPTPTATATETSTATQILVVSNTPTATPSATSTTIITSISTIAFPTPISTVIVNPTPVQTVIIGPTPSRQTPIPSATRTSTRTATNTRTFTTTPTATATVTETPTATPTIQLWYGGNGAATIFQGEMQNTLSYFSSVTNDSGDLIYLYNGDRVGTVAGRFNADKQWQILSKNGWSADPSAAPIAIDTSINMIREINLFQHPDTADGLMGVGNYFQRDGVNWFNVHGYPGQFIFDGISAATWVSGTTFDRFLSTPLISTWAGNGADFAFDPINREGLSVGIVGYFIGGFNDQLTATRYVHDDPAQKWRRWHRPSTRDSDSTIQWGQPGFSWTGAGSWHTNNTWTGDIPTPRWEFVLNSDSDVANNKHIFPKITHIRGTRNYLVTFVADGAALPPATTGGAVKAALYQHEPQPGWSWWNGTAWEQGGNFQLQGIAAAYAQRVQADLGNGKVIILTNNSGQLTEVIYDDASGSFSQPAIIDTIDIAFGTTVPQYLRLAVDSNLRAWVAYVKNSKEIYTRYRDAGSPSWSSPELVLTLPNSGFPLGINFLGAEQTPVVFVANQLTVQAAYPQIIRNSLMAFARSSTIWNGEAALTIDRTSAPHIADSATLPFVKAVDNHAYHATYGAGSAGGLGVDSDGFVYAPRYGNTSLIVHPPHSNANTDNVAWGNFWDHVRFPGGAAVDDIRGKVYVSDLVTYGSGGTFFTGGRVNIWEKSRRDGYYGYQTLSTELPAVFNREYAASVLTRSFMWPADVSVDQARGLLYVTNGLQARIDVFDVQNLTNSSSTFQRTGLFEASLNTSNKPAVQQIVNSMVSANLLSDGGAAGDEGGSTLSWVSLNLEGEVIPFIKSDPAYLTIVGGYDDTDVIRSVMAHFKSYRDRPVFLYSFGTRGNGPGQFSLPHSHDLDAGGNIYVVDSDSHRINKFNINATTNRQEFAWSAGDIGSGPGQFLYPTRIAVNSPAERICIVDAVNNRIQLLDLNGNFLYEANGYTANDVPQLFNVLSGVAFGPNGELLLGSSAKVLTFGPPMN